jgi:hypothetical protein
MYTWRADLALDLDVRVEFLGETLQIAEPNILAGKLAQAFADSGLLCSALSNSIDTSSR